MLEKSNSQYDAFLFWRQPIPALDMSELKDLGLIDIEHRANSSKAKGKPFAGTSRDEEVELSEFSSFNYWRAPIVSVDDLLADLNLLL